MRSSTLRAFSWSRNPPAKHLTASDTCRLEKEIAKLDVKVQEIPAIKKLVCGRVDQLEDLRIMQARFVVPG